MKYKSFEITNYRGIRRVRLDLAARPASSVCTLVGLNESGKTTILEALSHFHYGRTEEEVELFGTGKPAPDRLIPISRRANFSDEITISAAVEVEPADVEALTRHLAKHYPGRTFDLDRTEFDITQRYVFKDSRYDDSVQPAFIWFVQVMETTADGEIVHGGGGTYDDEWLAAVNFLKTRLPVIRYFPNFLFEFPDRLYLEPRVDSPKERFYHDLVAGIVESVGIGATLEDHLLARAKSTDPQDAASLDGLLLEMSRHVTRQLFSAWNAVLERKVHNKEVVIDLQADEDGRTYVRFRIKDADGHFTLSERSLGFRWFFAYLLLTTYAGALSADGRTIMYVFDEPASNLHPSAQAQLLKSFKALAEQSVVIYATHSPHLINPDWLENTYVVKNAAADPDTADDFTAARTDISLERYRSFASTHPDQSRYFQPVLDVLAYRPSRLEMVPDVVMVEGKTDFYALMFLQDTLGLVPRLNFMPGTGAGTLALPVQLYLGWSRNFVVLLDGDAEARKQATRYESLFGDIIVSRLATLQDVFPEDAPVAVEGLIAEEDRLVIQRLVYPGDTEYRKQHMHRAIQEMAVRRPDLTLTPKTTAAAIRLHHYLAERLAVDTRSSP